MLKADAEELSNTAAGKKYSEARLECATAENFKTCLRAKMGDVRYYYANLCSGGDIGGPVQPLVGDPAPHRITNRDGKRGDHVAVRDVDEPSETQCERGARCRLMATTNVRPSVLACRSF